MTRLLRLVPSPAPTFTLLPLLLALVAGPGVASAAVIYGDDALPGGVAEGLYSDLDGVGQQVAQAITLDPGGSTITGIHWWGAYHHNFPGGDGFVATDDFSIRIYADVAGTPELNPSVLDLNVGAVDRVATGVQSSIGLDIWFYSVEIAPVVLAPGVAYHFQIVNDTPGDLDDWIWSWPNVFAPHAGWSLYTDQHSRVGDGQPWNHTNVYTFLFYLTDDTVVPEPSGSLLIGLALGAFAVAARRRPRAPQSP